MNEILLAIFWLHFIVYPRRSGGAVAFTATLIYIFVSRSILTAASMDWMYLFLFAVMLLDLASAKTEV